MLKFFFCDSELLLIECLGKEMLALDPAKSLVLGDRRDLDRPTDRLGPGHGKADETHRRLDHVARQGDRILDRGGRQDQAFDQRREQVVLQLRRLFLAMAELDQRADEVRAQAEDDPVHRIVLAVPARADVDFLLDAGGGGRLAVLQHHLPHLG